MKKNWFRRITLAGAACIGVLLTGCQGGNPLKKLKPAETLTGIVRFTYGYSGGSYAFSGNNYTATLEDGVVTVTIRRDGKEDPVSFTADQAFLDRLTEIANEHEVSRWDGFDKADSNVLDGDSFSISLTTDSGQHISAHGYESYPNGYRDAANAFEAPFIELYEEHIPNQGKLLQKYLEQTLIPEIGMADKDEFSFAYLASEGPAGERGYFMRETYAGKPGILGYIVSDYLYEDQARLIVYTLDVEEEIWSLNLKYYGLNEQLAPVLLGEEVLDANVMDHDGIYVNVGRCYDENSEPQIAYSAQKKSIGGEGTITFGLKLVKLHRDHLEVLGAEEVTGAADREAWTEQQILPLITLAKEHGFARRADEWKEKPYDAVLGPEYGRDVSITASANVKSGFYEATMQTEIGEKIGDFCVNGRIHAVAYDY